ncbi:hypothetical protein MY10362_006537 [Beauveria mimosiformis]
MEALQSEDHRNLLDIIDKLRSKGVSRYVDLPQIVVCGDQSTGKSSVLEAISGLTFPTKDNLCTRFATELILRREATKTVNISIHPGPERSADERRQLNAFRAEIDVTNPDLQKVVEEAKIVGAVPATSDNGFPGLFRAGNREQTTKDAKVVHKMVRGYVRNPRSIILAVVSAKNDFALQEITEMARELDPKGIRTLGLITKPDTLDAGSDSEAAVVNDVVKLIVDHVAVQETASGISSIVRGSLELFKSDLEVKFTELHTPHIESHPITYNHYLTDTVQKVQEERRQKSLKTQFCEAIGREQFPSGHQTSIYPARVFNQLQKHIEVDMERYGGELAVDYMEAYYKLASKKFIDDISVLAVERCLISRLPALFPSETMLDLRDDEIAHIATESDAMMLERIRYNEKLVTLEGAKDDLKQLDIHRTLDLGKTRILSFAALKTLIISSLLPTWDNRTSA